MLTTCLRYRRSEILSNPGSKLELIRSELTQRPSVEDIGWRDAPVELRKLFETLGGTNRLSFLSWFIKWGMLKVQTPSDHDEGIPTGVTINHI
jgi:hypothetical protein